MHRHHSHRTIDRILASPLMLILLLVLTGVIGNAVWNIYGKERITRERADMAQSEVSELRDRKTFLEEELEALETPEGQERALREQFGVAKPGEQMIVLVDDPNAPVGESSTDESFWQKIKEFFGQ